MDITLEKVSDRLKKKLLETKVLPSEIEAMGIFGSFGRGTFTERSDIDIFFIVKGEGVSRDKEIEYRKKVKEALDDFERDITVMAIPRQALERIDNWYILRLATEGILLLDRGEIRSLFSRIVDKAGQLGLVEEDVEGTKVWVIKRSIHPGEIFEVKLNDQ